MKRVTVSLTESFPEAGDVGVRAVLQHIISTNEHIQINLTSYFLFSDVFISSRGSSISINYVYKFRKITSTSDFDSSKR